VLDRRLKFWHVCVMVAAALAWFAGMTLATQAALPGVGLFRCPIGLCFGYYAPVELQATLTRVGKEGRQFLAQTLLPLDTVLPALLAAALILVIAWFSRARGVAAVPLGHGAVVRTPALLPRRLRRELGAGGGTQRFSRDPLPIGTPCERADRCQVAACDRGDWHRAGARAHRVGARLPALPAQYGLVGALAVQAPGSCLAKTLRAARKHSTPSGTPA